MDTKDEAIKAIESECFEIMYKKNRDYGDNISRHGEEGVIIRLYDKMCRLDQVFHAGNAEVVDESLEDTILDMRNYLTILLLLRRNEWELPWEERDYITEQIRPGVSVGYPPKQDHCPPHQWIKGSMGGPWVCRLCGQDKERIERWERIKERDSEGWHMCWGDEKGPSEVE